jgi:hypothetical protein
MIVLVLNESIQTNFLPYLQMLRLGKSAYYITTLNSSAFENEEHLTKISACVAYYIRSIQHMLSLVLSNNFLSSIWVGQYDYCYCRYVAETSDILLCIYYTIL